MPEKYQYFEVCIGPGPEENEKADFWMCIRTKPGTKPGIAALTEFLKSDLDNRPGSKIIGFYLIDEQTARSCYDFSNEPNWPVFA